MVLTIKYVVPLTVLIVVMIAVIFFGVATPTEAASLGTFASFALAAIYGRLTWAATRDAHVLHAEDFGDGAGDPRGLAGLHAIAGLHRLGAKARRCMAGTLPIPPIWVIVLMHFVTLLLGGPIGGIPLIMMTIPIFIPVVKALGYDPIWFCTAMLLERRTGPDHAAVRHSALRRAWDYAEHLDGRDHARRRSDHRHPT